MAIEWEDVGDLSLSDLRDILENNYNLDGDWEDKAISLLFDDVATTSYVELNGYVFKQLEYDVPHGDGEKTLVFAFYRTLDKYSYTSPRKRIVGTFRITGHFNSWDNGQGAGYWEDNIVKVVKKTITKEVYETVYEDAE